MTSLLVGPLLIIHSEMVLFRIQVDQFENSQSMPAVQVCQTNRKSGKRFMEAYKLDPTNACPVEIAFSITRMESNLHWHWLGLACKTNLTNDTNMQKVPFPDCVLQLLLTSFYQHNVKDYWPWGAKLSRPCTGLLFNSTHQFIDLFFDFVYTGWV